MQLSKWWETPSAQAAMKRAKDQRLARIAKVKDDFRARKQKLIADVNNLDVGLAEQRHERN